MAIITGPGNIEQVDVSVPQEGQIFRLDVGEGASQLYGIRDGKIYSFNYQDTGVVPRTPSGEIDWQGRTIGSFINQANSQIINQLGVSGEIPVIKGDAWDVLRKQYGAPQTIAPNDFVSNFTGATPAGATQVNYSPNTSSPFYDPNNPNQPNYSSIPGYGTSPATQFQTSQPLQTAGLSTSQPLNAPTSQPANTGGTGGQIDPVYAQNALNLVYQRRPDLQALYNPDGTAKNPNDPRIAGIPTLLDWANQYGVNEEPSLQNLGSQGGQTGGSNLPPELQVALDAAKNMLAELQKRGQIINPNVEITPDKLAEFTALASKEIDPYYSTQLKLATDTFLKSIGYSETALLNQEKDIENKYGINLRTIAEGSAEQGFAQSGLRKRDERQLALDTQNVIDTNRRQLEFNAGNAAAGLAQQYGGSALSNVPTISNAPRVLPGQGSFAYSGTSRPLYQLSPDVYNGLVGSQQYEQEAAKRNRVSELEGAFRQGQAINQQRQLIL